MEKNENGYYIGTPSESLSDYNMNIRSAARPHQLAMAYSPYQCWRMLYSEADALNHGTLFEELYKPLEDGCV